MDAAQFLPDCTPNELVEYYVTFGGTPYYLAQLDATPDAYPVSQATRDKYAGRVCFLDVNDLYEMPTSNHRRPV